MFDLMKGSMEQLATTLDEGYRAALKLADVVSTK
jgi:hypothetical protein